MRIQRKEEYLVLSEVHPDDYYLFVAIISSMHKLLSEIELDSFTDNQDKELLKKDIERILADLSVEKGSKTAESQKETIIRKVIERAINKTT